MGIMAAKLTIQVPSSDSFVLTDSKGKTIISNITISLNPDSTYCLFVQKRPAVGIVSEDVLIVSGGKKMYQVALKPAVSLVSLEELESVTDSPSRPTTVGEPIIFSRDDFAPEDFDAARASAPKAKAAKPPEQKHEPTKKIRKPSEPIPSTDILENPPSEEEEIHSDPIEPDRGNSPPGRPGSEGLAPPQVLEAEPMARKSSGIPGKRRRPDLSPDADVLEQSLQVKFSLHDDEMSRDPGKVRLLPWYDQETFNDLAEPDFSFELMMTGDNEDPVFCINGDYYDASGRLLSVQQGKGKVIYVTQEGFDPAASDD
jgi:hypothetical protein